MRGMRPEVAEAIAKTWNAHWPVGTKVTLIRDLGDQVETRTRSEAWVVGGGTVLIKLDGISGGYLLERVVAHALAEARS
jgi:hypothetical protein